MIDYTFFTSYNPYLYKYVKYLSEFKNIKNRNCNPSPNDDYSF